MDTRLFRLQRLLRLNHPRYHNRERLTLRDHLALERTRLGNERTLLSYTRSSLYLLIGGIALVQVEGHGNFRYVGYLSLVFSGLFVIVGFYRFLRLRKQLDRYYTFSLRDEAQVTEPSDGA